MNALAVGADVVRRLQRAEKNRTVLIVNGVTIYPPDKRGYWRLQRYVNGKALSRSGGRTAESAYEAAVRLGIHVEKLQTQSYSGITVEEILKTYLEGGGRAGMWAERTYRNRVTDFRPLIDLFGPVAVEDFSIEMARSFVNTAGTAKRHSHLKNVLGTFLKWVSGAGHLPAGFADRISVISYVGASPRLSRRAQASTFSDDLDGEVPTHLQVENWARQCGLIVPEVAWMIRLAAVTGLRLSELLALTLDTEQAKNGQGNLIDLSNGQIRVTCQSSSNSSGFIPPKRGKRRTVTIPPDSHIPHSGLENSNTEQDLKYGPKPAFTLNEWLENQAPRQGLLFPNSKAGTWGITNLRGRVLAPAADKLGWRMEPYETKRGTRALYRFTFHSLRSRYATTAAGEWGFTRPQLQAQGGWEAGVVERFYQRYDDNVSESVNQLFGRKP